MPKQQVLYSLYGYIRGSETGEINIVDNGKAEPINLIGYNTNKLPVVRYLFPIPQEAIARSGNRYKQHYGY